MINLNVVILSPTNLRCKPQAWAIVSLRQLPAAQQSVFQLCDYQPAGSIVRLLSLCLSVCLSVCHMCAHNFKLKVSARSNLVDMFSVKCLTDHVIIRPKGRTSRSHSSRSSQCMLRHDIHHVRGETFLRPLYKCYLRGIPQYEHLKYCWKVKGEG